MLRFELKMSNRNVPDEELIRDLRRVAALIGKSKVTTAEYNKSGRFGNWLLQRRFGSWLNALREAGLEVTKYQNVATDELLDNLEKVWISLGRQPSCDEMRKPLSKYCAHCYMRRFGTWRKALEAFVGNRNEGIEPAVVRENAARERKIAKEISWQTRFKVMKRDNFKCKCCGASPAKNADVVLHVDHIKPRVEGGETAMENLQTLCSVCNIGKGGTEARAPE